MFWNKRLIATAALGSGLLATCGLAQQISTADRKFMEEAARGGKIEVAMGKLAIERGGSQAVKDFGQQLLDDHSKANHELMVLAQQKGVTLPSDEPAVPASLAAKTGAAFDRAFAKAQVADHRKDIAEFQKEGKSGSDADVKSWASKTVPTLESHLTRARALESTASSSSPSNR